MHKTLTVIAILASLGAPAAAAPDRVVRAQQIASGRWSAVCGGAPIGVSRGLTDGATARAYYAFDGQHPDNAQRYRKCTIKFRNGAIPAAEFCTAMVHEYGHLAGWRPAPGAGFPGDHFHSGNPNSVMYPHYVRPWAKC